MLPNFTSIITIKFTELRNTPTSGVRNEIKLRRIRFFDASMNYPCPPLKGI